MKPLRGNRNQCGACGELFNSNWPFELHRTGEYGVNRRCKTRDEMLAAGMSLNKDGFWIGETKEQRRNRENKHVEEGETTVQR